jgi:hypothetical protein
MGGWGVKKDCKVAPVHNIMAYRGRGNITALPLYLDTKWR